MLDRCVRVIRAAAAAVVPIASAGCAPHPPPSPPFSVVETAPDTVPRPTVRAWPAMGALLQMSVWDADTARALAAMEAARAAVLRVDALMSADQPASEVAALNRRAGTDSATTLSPWTAEVLDSVLSVAATFGTAADVSISGRVSRGPVREPWREVRFDRAAHRASLPRGMRLELGAVARGFAVDRGLDALRAAGIRRAVLDLGGTFATLGTAPVGPRWSMGLANPFIPGEVFAALQMDSGAVATWTGGGMGDTDSTARIPGRGIASTSVMAPSALLANALSNLFFLVAPAEGCRLAARYPGVDVVWVRVPGDASEEERDADEGVDPELVVITDALADRLELLSEEPTDERPTRCSQVAR